MKVRSVAGAIPIVVLLVSSTVTAGTASASAATVDGETTVSHLTGQRCLAARAAAMADAGPGVSVVPASSCDVTIIGTVSSARRLSSADSAVQHRAQGLEADTNPVYAKSYHYTVYQGTDQENMKGTYYYDGFNVWQSTSYRSRIGSKSCWVSYSITYSVDVKACTGGGISTNSISAHMQLWVTLAKLTPLSWREDYYVTMKPTGTSSIRKA